MPSSLKAVAVFIAVWSAPPHPGPECDRLPADLEEGRLKGLTDEKQLTVIKGTCG